MKFRKTQTNWGNEQTPQKGKKKQKNKERKTFGKTNVYSSQSTIQVTCLWTNDFQLFYHFISKYGAYFTLPHIMTHTNITETKFHTIYTSNMSLKPYIWYNIGTHISLF